MNRVTNCIINRDSSYMPIWFMRQAGRYLPEFRKIREINPDFVKLCLTPNLVSEITLQPINRFDIDAAIIFSDILMIPYGLGQDLKFEKGLGPKLGNLNIDNIIKKKNDYFLKKVLPVYEGIKRVKEKIKNKDLIGFVGAPWTILVYMLNGESPKKNFDLKKILKEKTKIKNLLAKIVEIICLHADKQIEAGANVIQIFDSWAELLPLANMEDYCYSPTKKIVEHIKKSKVSTICFPKGIKEEYSNFCSRVKPDCISIDYNIDPDWIKKKVNGIPIQGGMDPKILLTNKTNIEKNVKKYINIFSDYPYIFNLGHGVLPQTKPEAIQQVVKIIRENTK